MDCVQFGVNINNDVDNKLKNLLESVAGADSGKLIVMGGYLNSNEFLEHCRKDDKVDDNVTKLVDINGNTLKRLLNEYYKERHISIENDISKRNADTLDGFLSERAKAEALDHSATLVTEIYYSNLSKPKDQRINRQRMIAEVIKEFNNHFKDVVVIPLIKALKAEGMVDDITQSAINAHNEYIAIAKEYNNKQKIYKILPKEQKEGRKQLKKEIDDITERLNTKEAERYVAFQNLINTHGNTVQRNYANLVSRVRQNPNAWFNKVFQGSKLTSLAREFEEVLEQEKLADVNFTDDNDAVNDDNSESVDEMSKSWEDKLYASFEKAVAADLKLYFNTLRYLSAPVEQGQDPKDYAYDNNTEIGVPRTMNANYVITQLSNYGNFNSIGEFIESIFKASRINPQLYALGQIANKMIADPIFANYVFTNLANPKVKKTIVVMTENGIDFNQSNKAVEPLTFMIYQMFNSVKNTYRTNFSIYDITNLSKLNASLKSNNLQESTFDKYYRQKADDLILDILYKYFPKTDKNVIINYLYSGINRLNNYRELIGNLIDLVQTIENVVDNYNTEYSKFIQVWKGYQQAIEADPQTARTAPVFDISNVNFDKLYTPVIQLAKKLIQFDVVKNELNSTNAEGNLASDLIGNNYITNFFKQIQYGNEKDVNAGLNRLAEELQKTNQYDYSPIFYGVKDSKGNVIVPGLFNKDINGKVTVNPDAKNLLDYSLFDGAKDRTNAKSAMYDMMSKGDYFLTQLIAFGNPIGFGENIAKKRDELVNEKAGFFMRTPSDAPKNFIIQGPKYNMFHTNRNVALYDTRPDDVKAYVDRRKAEIQAAYSNKDLSAYSDIINKALSMNRQTMSAEDIYEVMTGQTDTLNYNNKRTLEHDSEVIYPVRYEYDKGDNKKGKAVVVLQGRKVGNNNIMNDIKVLGVIDESGNKDFPVEFYNALSSKLKEEGIDNESIKLRVNPDNPIFRAFRTHLLNELSTFVNKLNNVFEKDKDGKWVSKTDTRGLVDRAHYNGEIVENGRLTGFFFRFNKLFESNGYNVNEEMMKALLLYGEGNAVFLSENGRLVLNEKRTDLINLQDGTIKLNISEAIDKQLTFITAYWLSNFRREIIARSRQYDTIIDERYKRDDILEAMYNAAIMNMNFDDMFEGSTAFYKNAQDFLKRAKEVQAAGKAYAGFNLDDTLSSTIKNVVDKAGKEQPILINGNQYMVTRKVNGKYQQVPMMARNGFRAVTIKNTIRASERAANIQKELYGILSKKLSENEAERISTEIAKGYFENTKVNDAQSYITFDEFIARKYADGTLNQYMDIIQQILDVREGRKTIADIDLANINARIQVQKNFYYDQKVDNTGTRYSRQIKNAEFVLIPELIAGTELEQLYNIMVSHDIGQVNTEETSKAAKRNVLTFWDNNKQINPNFVADIEANNEDAIEDFYYRYLYKQQDVPQHMQDEHNKAGIQIMKKIIDNANEEVQPYINEFFASYCANIREDFNTLIGNMGWKVADDGSLINADGSPNLDFSNFYKKARAEAQRLGLDSNFAEYLTPDILGNPRMPNYMNNVSTKLESIAQAIFNSAITRQTLPGWHAAQVTPVGHGVKVMDSDGKFRELAYHPEVTDENGNVIQEAYAEIMIPRWSKLIPGDYTIEELAEAGLDIQIGYRIPTEGKQSVSIMRVVGFLHDIYGSTIMLPDEWVTQTGADFDVDSVYGIYFKMYRDRQGKLHKIELDRDESQEAVERRYIAYVKQNIKEKVEKDTIDKEELRAKAQEVYDELFDPDRIQNNSKQFEDLFAQSLEVWDTLPNDFKKEIYAINRMYKDKSQIVQRYTEVVEKAKYYAETETDDYWKGQYEKYAEISQQIADILILTQSNINEFLANLREAKANLRSEAFNEVYNNYLEKIKKAAEDNNLVSLEEFKSWSIYEQNSRNARDNAILDNMIKILSNENSREENYSRSNFDDIEREMKLCDSLRGATKLARSAYNPLDQIDFMENAISGRQLKAFSVTRDTFNSVNNYIKSQLNDSLAISVEYNAKEYDVYNAVKCYGFEEVTPYDKDDKVIETVDKLGETVRFVVKHKMFANSLHDNRNIVGKLVTVYSSQTTAHILDAIKEGAIYNENEYTFGTFKTLIDLGIDYGTAIAFLQQPGITEIVNANNETKSIYINQSGNPIHTAIRRIAKRLNITDNGEPITDYTRISKVYELLMADNNFKIALSELIGSPLSDDFKLADLSISLNKNMLHNRLKNSFVKQTFSDKKYSDAVFDIAIVLFFNKARQITLNIEKLARCSNPDRFGAKQTIRATRQILDNIRLYAADYTNPVTNTLVVKTENGNKSIIDALYPGFLSGNIKVEESAYPYLAAFLKYATIPSVNANKKLFATESDAFVKVLDYVQSKLGVIFDDDQYREYKQYMISDIYNNVEKLLTPLTINEFGLIVPDTEHIQYQEEHKDAFWNAERGRIFGYDVTESESFTIADINNPTAEEISKFNRLTPAQKVIWIQAHFVDGRGIFDYLNVNTFNEYEFKHKGFTNQTITFNDTIDNIEEVFRSFREAFYHKNPLVRLATIDLIKYSFIVEGFKFKRNSISKLITNDSLYSDLEHKGFSVGDGLIGDIQSRFMRYTSINDTMTESFIEKFIRSHSEMVREVRIPKAKNTSKGQKENIGNKFNKLINGTSDGLMYIPFDETGNNILQLIDPTYDEAKPEINKDYIRINRFISNKVRQTTLYKIRKVDGGIYLIPLNLLERNEVAEFSANPKLNQYKSPKYYDLIVNTAIGNNMTLKDIFGNKNYTKVLNNQRKLHTIKPHTPKKVNAATVNMNEIENQKATNTNIFTTEALTKFTNDIAEAHAKLPVEGTHTALIHNDHKYIASLIPLGTTIYQNIHIGDDTVTVEITRYKPTKKFRNKLTGAKDDISNTPLEADIFERVKNSKSINPNLYKVTFVTDEEVKKDSEDSRKAYDEEAEKSMMAITSAVDDINVDPGAVLDIYGKTAKLIYNDIDRRHRLNREDTSAESFLRSMDMAGLDPFRNRSINSNKKNVFVGAADYFENLSHILLDRINNFHTIDGQVFALNDKALYDYLKEHAEDYQAVVKTILDAKTFGDQIALIFSLDIQTDDPITNKAIERIRNAINEVRNNTIVNKAMDLFFNDYIANEFSTNPVVRQGLVELRTIFGDTNWFDLNFNDVAEINHKQVQTVVKYVYSILDEATRLIAPKAVSEFTKMFDSILAEPGSFNFDNIITKEGKFIKPYTDKFMVDRQKHIDAVREAKENYGIDSIQYIKAKLERDKWRANNIEQPALQSYYLDELELREHVINYAPDVYREYMKLRHELYNGEHHTTMTPEELKRRADIRYKISRLLDPFDDDGKPKDRDLEAQIAEVNRFVKEKAALDNKYFRYNETESFKQTLKYYLNIIKRYEKANPNATLEEKLTDREYRLAYDWIKTNTYYSIDKDERKKINDAFSTLSGSSNLGAFIKNMYRNDNAYDEYGNYDPLKLSVDNIRAIKKETERAFTFGYDSALGERSLIKMIPTNIPVFTNKFYIDTGASGDTKQNPERLKLIKQINDLIRKGIDTETGLLTTKDLFENLTKDELKQLGDLYKQIRQIKSTRTKAQRQAFDRHAKRETNDKAFNKEYAYYLTNIKGNKQLESLWINIFCQLDRNNDIVTDNDGHVVGNSLIYGYIMPKDKQYIDEAKTKAREFIEKNVVFEANEAYYIAMDKAIKENRFHEWFEDNHVYNPYTQRYERLRIWNDMRTNPNGDLKGKFEYRPTDENKERVVRDGTGIYVDLKTMKESPEQDMRNTKYKPYEVTYNQSTGQYNNNVNLSPKEQKMLSLLQSVMTEYSQSYGMRKFAEKGFLPRKVKRSPDTEWFIKQAFGTLGLEFRNPSERKWDDIVDYANDYEPDFDMTKLIKQKGSKEVPPKPTKGSLQSDEDYEKSIAEWEKDKAAIEAENLRLDNELLDRDWRTVFQDFITNATEYNAKQRVKNTIYLLLEDLKSNPAYKESSWSNNLIARKKLSTNETTDYATIPQLNTYALVQNWARRILFNEFKKSNKLSKYADLMQNVTSAKYMIFNVTGGIANVGTGMANIFNEVFAREYFDYGTFNKARERYFAALPAIIRDMYSPTSDNLTVGIIKLFNIVDFDAIAERRPNETTSEYVKRFRDSLYALQSGGEHYMQNTALLAMMETYRWFLDSDGAERFGSFAEYTWDIEKTTLLNVLSAEPNSNELLINYKIFLNDIKDDLNLLKAYDQFERDFNEEYLRGIGDKKLMKKYIEARKKAIANARKEFENDKDHPTVISQFVEVDGYARLKHDAKMTGRQFGEFRRTVIQVNKKIHGIYDKIGAAKIEAEWWGGLVMQYHKHLYPGIMKRYRTKGMFNEIRGTVERGSYVTLGKFLTTEFRGISDKVKKRSEEDNENIVLASIQEFMKASIATITEASLNWNLMPEWERNNIKRILGDLLGVAAAITTSMAIYMMTDDDDLKDNEGLATALYITDRLLAEAQMYTPWGFVTEAKTLWSSPVAMGNTPKDLIKALGYIAKWLYDEDYDMDYTTGLYKGQNKLEVLLYRNTPAYRIYQRLSTMTKNNSYYRINENALNLKVAKGVADALIPD